MKNLTIIIYIIRLIRNESLIIVIKSGMNGLNVLPHNLFLRLSIKMEKQKIFDFTMHLNFNGNII